MQKATDDQKAALASNEAARTAAEAPDMAAANSLSDKLSKQAEEPVKTLPMPENAAKHLDPKELMSTAQAFMVAGSLFGLLSRQPLTAAMNNMTAAMKGVQEADGEQYDKAMNDFKVNFDKTMKLNDALIKAKQDAMNDTKLALTARMEKLRLIDMEYDNAGKYVEQSFKMQMQMFDAQMKSRATMATRAQTLELQHQRLQMERERLGMERERMSRQEAKPAGGIEGKLDSIERAFAKGSLSQGERDAARELIIKGRTRPLLGEERAAAQSVQLKLANQELQDLESNGATMPILADIHFEGDGTASALGRYGQKRALTDEEQQLVTAAQLYAEAAGHIQSGARLTDQSFARAVKEFIQQPGDKPGAMEMKKAHRDALVRASDVLSGEAGRKLREGTGGSAEAPKAKPTLDQFLAKAKAANPGKSDADLKAYYLKKYGGQ